MSDLIEVQYWLAEARRAEGLWNERLESLLQQKRSLEDDLAEVNHEIGEARAALGTIADSVSQLEEVEPMLLSEVDATTALKAARNNFDPELERYSTEANHDFERVRKALYTVGASFQPYAPGEKSDLWVIDIVSIPDVYRWWLYGEDEVVNE